MRVADMRWPSGRLRLNTVVARAILEPRHLLLLAAALATMLASAAEDIAVQTERLQQLRGRIHDITSDVESMRGQRTATQAALEKAEKEIGSVAAELHQLDADAETTARKIATLNNDRDTERQKLSDTRQMLAMDMQSAYAAGSQQRIKLLLNQQDPAMVGRMMTYHGYFTRARAGRVKELRATLASLDGIEHALVEQQAEGERLRLQQREKSARLTVEQNNRRQILAQLQHDLQARTTELSTLQQDEQRLQALLQSLQQALRDVAPEGGNVTSLRQLKGKLHWPVAGRIVQPYGAKQASGELQSSGVLIASVAGADVHAIANGRIAFADWLRGFGLLLIIDHGDGYMSLYGQNRSLYKDVGAWVKRGEVVAAAGSSGGRNQDGLYLELRKDGRPFNPTAWFSGQPLPLQADRQ
jgi:septal ring factor EnvC (AmiA/AmiB activator)